MVSAKLNAMTKVCVICGKEFTPKAYNQVYCSDTCANAREKERKREWGKQYHLKKKQEREENKKRLTQAGEQTPVKRKPLYESANMNAIAELVRNNVHYGLTVAEMYIGEKNGKSIKRR